MKSVRVLLISGFILLMSVTAYGYVPCAGDLIFVVAGESEFSTAISESTRRDASNNFDHVGIIYIDKDSVPRVIEASPQKSVCIIDYADFVADSSNGYVIKRVNIPCDINKIVDRALGYVGQPYDWWYLPENGKMYCSELIYESFVDEDEQPVFSTVPMNFFDESGTLPQFWKDLYDNLGMSVPQGIEGTNPNQLAAQKCLDQVYEAINSKE